MRRSKNYANIFLMNEDSPLSFHAPLAATANEAAEIQLETKENGKERKRKELVLARALIERGEIFRFPGIDAEAYAKMKAEEEESPGCATPVDKLIERFKNEGMKVLLEGPKINDSESGNVFIVPAQSDDSTNDSIVPRHLELSGVANEQLRALILLNKSWA